ncbi:L-2-amino-thiazoline-4-carboxylic acid hydrolase [Epibacterium sp. Ofav1-8]|uniref:L-2-amino-thiazoline-4-carboxylic acid hydrolase n=1 Tax=Epibacterium sp. Ofav1-8 TaxID=2917735 RepID=UPI001EF4CCAF|nr:L-2-amino-thiazoline-4-carboxylic acid hydrolase [Epibacterium sp. Ofav1-8]MCG7625143.1 L-2-amino-thiazoline-4-carboxylic acid hydrolase [Epibacterium sp. Ofav1-8]
MMAAFWQIEFARNLSRQSGIRFTWRNLRGEIARLPRSTMPGTDGAHRFNLALAQSLHASVILLERDAAISPVEAVRIAGAAFGVSGTWLARSVIRTWLRLERDPFEGVVRRGPSMVAKALWGNGMAVEDRHGPDQVSLCVLACPFHEYFWNVGRSDLTPILCAWDTAWHAEVNVSDKPIRVDVRETIAGGGEICDFNFRKPEPAKVG